MRILVNGVRLFVEVQGTQLVPEGATMASRPTVVLLHGGPGFDHSSFQPEFSRLAEVAQVISYDHRGNGRSDRGDRTDWNLDTWADDVKALCDALDIDKPIVLGWSFGSFVALRYAARYPDHPAKLVLQSPALRMNIPAVIAAFESIGTPEQAAVARAFWTDPTPEAMAAYAEHCIPLYDTAPLGERLARTVLNFDLLAGFDGQTTMDLQADAASVRVPTLVAAGRLDPIMPIAAAHEVVEALADVTFEIFKRSSHFIHSSEPDRYFELLARFVTS